MNAVSFSDHVVLSPSYVRKMGEGYLSFVVFGCLIYEMCFVNSVYYLNTAWQLHLVGHVIAY